MFEPLDRVFSVPKRPILFEDGVGSVLDTNTNNKHVFPILRGDHGVHSRHATQTGAKQNGLVAGNQMTLVAGYQSTYNLRVILAGSMKMCSNQAMMANRDPEQGNTIQSSPNYVLCTEMVEWNL
jgi:alanine dehydrogenase